MSEIQEPQHYDYLLELDPRDESGVKAQITLYNTVKGDRPDLHMRFALLRHWIALARNETQEQPVPDDLPVFVHNLADIGGRIDTPHVVALFFDPDHLPTDSAAAREQILDTCNAAAALLLHGPAEAFPPSS